MAFPASLKNFALKVSAPIRKALVAAASALAVLADAGGDGHLSQSEGILVILAIMGAYGVWAIPNAQR